MGRTTRGVLLVASLLLTSSAWSSGTYAQIRGDTRVRPWPDEWPIILPPTLGPLPPAPPLGPYTPPANRSGERIIDVLSGVRENLRDTRYQHHLRVRERVGMYRWDCSLMAKWVLQRAAPRSVRHLAEGRALAAHFARAIERAPTTGYRRGWQRIERIEQVRPGDVFAWRRPQGFPSRNTGHVGFVVGAPRPIPGIPNAYAVRVADATGSGHQNDTRPWPSEGGGFGIGTLAFLTDGHGNGTAYGWGGTLSPGYVVTPILFGRVR